VEEEEGEGERGQKDRRDEEALDPTCREEEPEALREGREA
jgi:hypothetical protein